MHRLQVKYVINVQYDIKQSKRRGSKFRSGLKSPFYKIKNMTHAFLAKMFILSDFNWSLNSLYARAHMPVKVDRESTSLPCLFQLMENNLSQLVSSSFLSFLQVTVFLHLEIFVIIFDSPSNSNAKLVSWEKVENAARINDVLRRSSFISLLFNRVFLKIWKIQIRKHWFSVVWITGVWVKKIVKSKQWAAVHYRKYKLV